MLIYERIYKKLEELGLLNIEEHAKIECMGGMMPLSVDVLYKTKDGVRMALAHNFIQNGDVMADPDMEIMVYPDRKMAEAMTYQLDSLGIYQEVYPEPGKVNPKLKKELNEFLSSWLSQLKANRCVYRG
jgi:uncharacterized protein YqiB (DUF1249 family)